MMILFTNKVMIPNLFLRIYKKFTAISFLLWFFVASTVYAQGYVPLEALPGVTKTGTNLSEYLSAIFNIGIGLAGVFAVLMIVIGGVQFIYGASNPSARNEAKKKITNAIFGLILAISSWLILYIINPSLIKNSLNISSVSVLVSPTSVSPIGATPIQTPTPTPLSVQYSTPQSPYSPTSYTSSNPSSGSPVSYSDSSSNSFYGTPGYSPTQPPYSPTSYNSSNPSSGAPVDYSTSNSFYKTHKFSTSNNLSYNSPKIKKIDQTNDFNMVKDCMSKKASGVCAPADLNSDGVINIADLLLLSGAFKYNVNGDKIINFKKGPTITSCFLKENSGKMLPPDPPCDDEMLDCPTIPGVQSFPVKCAVASNNDMVLTRIEFNKFKTVIKDSSSGRKVNLRSLYSNLFNLGCADEFSVSDCNLFNRNPLLGRIIYSTLVRYDTNKDGVADFTGGDPLADFNGDGVINSKDSAFIKFINKSIFQDKGFTPIKFTLGGIEAWMFKGKGFTDRQVVQYCIGKTPIMDCAMSDIDASCSKTVNINACDVTQNDLKKFDAETHKFDVNGDGVIDFSAPQSATATSTKDVLKNIKLKTKKDSIVLDNLTQYSVGVGSSNTTATSTKDIVKKDNSVLKNLTQYPK